MRLLWVSVLAVTLIAGAGTVARAWLLSDAIVPGTWVEDRLVPPQATLETWLSERQRQLKGRVAYIDVDGELYEASFGEIGIALDVERTAAKVRADREHGRLIGALSQRYKAHKYGLSYTGVFRFDDERARRWLQALAAQVKEPPRDARLDLRAHRRIEHRVGRALNVEETLARIERGERLEGAVFRAITDEIWPAVTTDMLIDIDVSRVLSSYETDFKHKAGARAVNIRVAANYLNGSIIAPGQVLSFNRVVGERSERRGFIEAPVIVKDEMERAVGGGVCQVATTLHAAAVYGLMDIVRRRSHSRASGYAPLGLDATVIDGEVDLRIKNPYPTAILVHAFLPTRHQIRIELLGREAKAVVHHSYRVVETENFVRRVTTKADVSEPERRQKGHFGYKIVSTVKAEFPDGRVEYSHYKSRYYPVPEVYWVPPSQQLSALPDLPEGAVDTVVDGKSLSGRDREMPDPDSRAQTDHEDAAFIHFALDQRAS